MDINQIVYEADARKAFVSRQALNVLSDSIHEREERLKLVSELSSNAHDVTHAALESFDRSTIKTLHLENPTTIILRYFSYALLTENAVIAENCMAELRKSQSHLDIPNHVLVQVLNALEETIVSLINHVSLHSLQTQTPENIRLFTDEAIQYFTQLRDNMRTLDKTPAQPFWQQLIDIGASIPEKDWAELPTDLSRNFEHYMYGAHKEEDNK